MLDKQSLAELKTEVNIFLEAHSVSVTIKPLFTL